MMFERFSKYRVPKRFIIVAMVFFGYGNIFYLHTNLAMAVVEITSLRNITDPTGNTTLVSFMIFQLCYEYMDGLKFVLCFGKSIRVTFVYHVGANN